MHSITSLSDLQQVEDFVHEVSNAVGLSNQMKA